MELFIVLRASYCNKGDGFCTMMLVNEFRGLVLNKGNIIVLGDWLLY